ncbi:MAG: fibronectin type III domain-containing protein [Candidatus Roizmanbacteria bacterium]
MDNTKVATLESFRTQKYNKWLGVGVGLTLSFLLLVAGSAAYFSGVFVEASNDAPQELIISKVTEESVRLDWTTSIENQGYVEYGTNPTSLTLIAPETLSSKNHGVDLSLLRPSTTYYFHIKVGDKTFDDAGNPWTFVTKQTSATALPRPTIPDTTIPTSTIAPIDNLVISPTIKSSTCPSTDCATIRSLLDNGCSTSDYLRAGCAGR